MKRRIIVVDDDNSILDLLRVLLETEGYQVEAFDSGLAALEAALAAPPDALVVDLMMPGLTGLDLIQALRENAITQSTPVVLCSAYYGDLHRSSAYLRQNRVDYLRKPFQIDDMLDTVERMIAEGAGAPAKSGAKLPRPSFQTAAGF